MALLELLVASLRTEAAAPELLASAATILLRLLSAAPGLLAPYVEIAVYLVSRRG